MTKDKKKVEEEKNKMEKIATDEQEETAKSDTPKEDTPKTDTPKEDDAQGWKKKADEYLDKYKRAQAELINFQNRSRREKDDAFKFAYEGFIRDLFPAMDSLRHSLQTLEDSSDPTAVLEGVSLIEKEFIRVFQKNGVEVIDTKEKAFDPIFHEAVATEETSEVEPNMIVEEVRRGWKLHSRVLRASAVRVAKASSEETGE